MERALAALAGSGLDSARFAVMLDPNGDPDDLDRSMTAVLAVVSGALARTLGHLDADVAAAWVADAWADPEAERGPADEVMSGWDLGTVAELRAAPPPDADGSAGWLVVDAAAPTEATDAQLVSAIEAALARGESPSRTAKAVAAQFGVSKRRVYDLVLALGEDR